MKSTEGDFLAQASFRQHLFSQDLPSFAQSLELWLAKTMSLAMPGSSQATNTAIRTSGETWVRDTIFAAINRAANLL